LTILINPYPLAVRLAFIAVGFAIATNHSRTIGSTKTVSKLTLEISIVTASFLFTGIQAEQKGKKT